MKGNSSSAKPRWPASRPASQKMSASPALTNARTLQPHMGKAGLTRSDVTHWIASGKVSTSSGSCSRWLKRCLCHRSHLCGLFRPLRALTLPMARLVADPARGICDTLCQGLPGWHEGGFSSTFAFFGRLIVSLVPVACHVPIGACRRISCEAIPPTRC